MLSNGHCLETGFPAAGQVITDQPSSRTFSLLNAGRQFGRHAQGEQGRYATMTDTDISLYQLTTTYAQIQSKYGISALELNAAHPTQGTAISVVSGYWKKIYSCNVDGFVYRLKEGDWTWKDSRPLHLGLRHHRRHLGIPGRRHRRPARSSPSTTRATRTASAAPANNPCEVDENGNVTSTRASTTPRRPTGSRPASPPATRTWPLGLRPAQAVGVTLT